MMVNSCLEYLEGRMRLQRDKAPLICGIHAELLKAGGNAVLVSLHVALCSAWYTGIIPTDWKRGLVAPLRKGKGNRQDGNIYRGVTMLSVPFKVFARIILQRVRHYLLEHQRPEQSALHQRGQRLTVSLLFGSSPNADERFSRGCLQPMLISGKRSIQ